LPDCDGCALVANIRFREDVTPILMLTEQGNVQETLKALRAGADDCLSKPFELKELVERARALLRRPNDFLGAQLTIGNVTFDTLSRQAFIDGSPLWLSWRELALLELLMRRPKHVLRKQVIENQLFGLLVGSKSNAIEVYVHRLRKSLVEGGASVQVHTIRGSGYMLTGTGKRNS
jgi:DNA-binding response OmpR family regulator